MQREFWRTEPAWTINQLAACIGMSRDFVLKEIRCGEIRASQFGVEWRIPDREVRRYLTDKGWPLPKWMTHEG